MYTSLKSQSLSCIRNNNPWSFFWQVEGSILVSHLFCSQAHKITLKLGTLQSVDIYSPCEGQGEKMQILSWNFLVFDILSFILHGCWAQQMQILYWNFLVSDFLPFILHGCWAQQKIHPNYNHISIQQYLILTNTIVTEKQIKRCWIDAGNFILISLQINSGNGCNSSNWLQ